VQVEGKLRRPEEEVGSGESEEGQLNHNAATKVFGAQAWEVISGVSAMDLSGLI
jgi:hypothetical protein